ncbi:cyclic lactone autoinducer peptide [Clostridium tertium]|uniref:Cyclic lactone autoinducer peptide n=1 Tax=Clostridium tertium TaxID=1559 RepID=A0A6N3DHF9_9CLOT
MKRLNNKFMMAVATIATVIASTVATSACFWCSYQPEEPKCLRDE